MSENTNNKQPIHDAIDDLSELQAKFVIKLLLAGGYVADYKARDAVEMAKSFPRGDF